MPRPFLTARWANIAIVSYAVPPAMLTPLLPAGSGLELDTRTDLGRAGQAQAFVSLVGLQMQKARTMGFRVPGHAEFPQMNLRFYVRQANQRGVQFIRGIVPRPLIAWSARRRYQAPILCAGLTSGMTQDTRTVRVEYRLRWPPKGWRAEAGPGPQPGMGVQADAEPAEFFLRVTGAKPAARPGPASPEHWFKERQFGFGTDAQGQPTVYEVVHPVWGVYPVVGVEVKLDFAAVFGPDWGFLSGLAPAHALLAVGSEVAVFPKRSTVSVRWGVRR